LRSADGNVIERIYIIPKKEIKGKRSSITIYKYRVSGLLYKNGWYEQYRVKDEEVMNKVNEIWKEIISDK